MNAHIGPIVGQNDDYNWDFCKAYVLLFSSFWTAMRTAFTSSTWLCFSASLDASLWICPIFFSSRLLLLWIFSNLSSCDFLSCFNFLICFSSSWLRFFWHWFSSYFSIILPSRYSFECPLLLLCFYFLIFVISVLLWFRSRKISSVLLDNTLFIFVISNYVPS